MSRAPFSVPVLESILDAIGQTPLVRVPMAGLPAAAEVWAKCEWFNPGGSVKDRTALSLVEEGERTGALRRGKTIIDSSSGNTAVGLALVGRAKGHPVELVMPESVNPERQALCRAYGAAIQLTDPLLGSDGALEEVRRRVSADPDRYFYADQYRNPANPLAHYRTTGPEVWEQTGGRVTHFVAGLGTTGTIVGAARYLHEKSARVRVVAVEPDHEMHGLEGLKHLPSAIVPEVYDPAAHDDKVTVSTEAAYATCAEVLRDHGLLVGHSAGAALWAAREVARAEASAVVVALLPDGGERYLGAKASR
ncbi:MAG TPA: PLP-dependent cysteine synthase family protein [Vicinamibacteria bacterium]|nr:PLP-dependent cysteine synthase family protein [Vicinamibacteria bacterium]